MTTAVPPCRQVHLAIVVGLAVALTACTPGEDRAAPTPAATLAAASAAPPTPAAPATPASLTATAPYAAAQPGAWPPIASRSR